ncbi:NmrA family transcriptional regulator [Spongiactinospora rosea]|uniref:NmrA family transcriptional regulator n=1 Tax=Spongiactinospora rosea TaxID=2248750 RepID=A0A366M6K3_9ACTN|nr:NAD(P)H-binding protein [Spongiactinospora rosea]RBQ21871.1 NmrA family transcriptional regulator [Spongiactinospora rosea]
MPETVLVTGGTGRLGRLLVPMLLDAGRQVRVLSRSGARAPLADVEYLTGDLVKGEGIERAVKGAQTVVHLAGGAKGDDIAAGHLTRAAARAGVEHIAHISVIAADRLPLGYFRAKLGAERAVADSGVPWTTLRAAQFHDLVLGVLGAMAKLPVMPAPGAVRLQPVDTRDVADRILTLALGDPAGLVADLAGPKVYGLADLARMYLRARGRRRALVPVPMPGRIGRLYREGANLTLSGADLGTRTWEDFLAEQL